MKSLLISFTFVALLFIILLYVMTEKINSNTVILEIHTTILQEQTIAIENLMILYNRFPDKVVIDTTIVRRAR